MNRGRLQSRAATAILALGLTACAAAIPSERWTLVAGTLVQAQLQDSLASRGKDAAENVSASVIADVMNARGEIVIPAGSIVALRVATYGVTARRSDRKNPLNVTSVMIRGAVYPMSVSVEPVTAGGGENELYSGRSDVVVMRGTRIMFSLPQPLSVSTR